MSISYKRVNWRDVPDTSTPLSAKNLNNMDEAIKLLDDNLLIDELDITELKRQSKNKVDKEDGKGLSSNDFTDEDKVSVSNLTSNGVSFKFGIDEDGNYGYYKDGADTVTPFKTGGGINTELFGGSVYGSGSIIIVGGNIPMFNWNTERVSLNEDVINHIRLETDCIIASIKDPGKYSVFIFINNYSDEIINVIYDGSPVLTVPERISKANEFVIETRENDQVAFILLDIPNSGNTNDRLDLVCYITKEKDE